LTNFSVASYSFHRLLWDGKQDMFKYIDDSKDLGMVQLDAWNGHLAPLIAETDALKSSSTDWNQAQFSTAGLEYIAQVRTTSDAAKQPFGCLAIDGAHIYEPTLEARAVNRAAAYRWLDAAARLGAKQVRVDSGGTPDFPDEQFEIVVDGFNDIIRRAGEHGIEIVIENHWGASHIPENVVKMLEAIDGLALLFDTNNFAKGTQERGWELCPKYARSVHIKTFEFDDAGNDPTVDIPRVIKLLIETGYNGVWGIESVPRNGDEYGAVKQTMALIERSIAAAVASVGGAA
jgi:sugar phosphate isomerase/epimerase